MTDESEVREMLRRTGLKVVKGSLKSRFDPYSLSNNAKKPIVGHSQRESAESIESERLVDSARAKSTKPAIQGEYHKPISVAQGYIIDAVEFIVDGEAVPKGRPRVAGKVAYTPKRTIDYERKVRVIAAIAMVGKEPFEFSVSISIEVYQKNKRRSDLDNILKAISDACNGVIYGDDSQINEIHIVRVHDETPRVKVTVSGKRLKEAA